MSLFFFPSFFPGGLFMGLLYAVSDRLLHNEIQCDQTNEGSASAYTQFFQHVFSPLCQRYSIRPSLSRQSFHRRRFLRISKSLSHRKPAVICVLKLCFPLFRRSRHPVSKYADLGGTEDTRPFPSAKGQRRKTPRRCPSRRRNSPQEGCAHPGMP